MTQRKQRKFDIGVSNRRGDEPRTEVPPKRTTRAAPPIAQDYGGAAKDAQPSPRSSTHVMGGRRERREPTFTKAASITGHSGHSEIVQQVVRDFFMSRPPSVILDVFRQRDTDRSGTLDFKEFKHVIKTLNIDLNEKDMSVLFRHADSDGSGVLEFEEFFNRFRSELSEPNPSEKEPFFWSKTRPRPLIPKSERYEMIEALSGKPSAQRTTGELMKMIQERVDVSSAKAAFDLFDDNKNGRLDLHEFCDAMKYLHIDVSPAQGEALICKINEAAGSKFKTHICYGPFAKSFQKGMDMTNTTGGGRTMGYANAQHADGDDNGNDEAGWGNAEVDQAHYGRRLGGISLQNRKAASDGGKFMDSVSIMDSVRTPRDQVAMLTAPRSKPSQTLRDEKEGSSHDKMSNWRGVDGKMGDIGPLTLTGDVLGHEKVNWTAFEGGPETLFAKDALGFPVEGAQQAALMSGRTKRLQAATAKASMEASGALSARSPAATYESDEAAVRRGAQTERLNLRAMQAAQSTRSMRDVLMPEAGCPTHAYDAERHVRTSREQWATENTQRHRQRMQDRNEFSALHHRQRTEQLQDALTARNQRADALDQARVRARESYSNRTKDFQLVMESKHELDAGKSNVIMEPPSSPSWPRGGPPQMVSHWSTINGQHNDPPARQHVRYISSYRRAFPGGDRRPLTPTGAQWGGDPNDRPKPLYSLGYQTDQLQATA